MRTEHDPTGDLWLSLAMIFFGLIWAASVVAIFVCIAREEGKPGKLTVRALGAMLIATVVWGMICSVPSY